MAAVVNHISSAVYLDNYRPCLHIICTVWPIPTSSYRNLSSSKQRLRVSHGYHANTIDSSTIVPGARVCTPCCPPLVRIRISVSSQYIAPKFLLESSSGGPTVYCGRAGYCFVSPTWALTVVSNILWVSLAPDQQIHSRKDRSPTTVIGGRWRMSTDTSDYVFTLTSENRVVFRNLSACIRKG